MFVISVKRAVARMRIPRSGIKVTMPIQLSRRFFRYAAILCGVFGGTQVFPAIAGDLPLPAGCEIAGRSAISQPAGKAPAQVFPPVQLQIRTPVEPTVLPSGGRNYLIYELHLQNFSGEPLTLRGIDVIDTDIARPLASLREAHLDAVLRLIGSDEPDGSHRLAPGQSAVAFLCLAFNRDTPVPHKLGHRVLLDNTAADGPAIGTNTMRLHVLGRPLTGAGWTAANGPDIHSHHRTGLFVAGGLAQISRRYAIDWRIEKAGAQFSGDARDVHSYHAYGAPVLAVAGGTVVAAQDGLPDNIPRTAAGFDTAVPITMENVGGNSIVIDLGDGQFAHYAHLKPGSVRVKPGDRVRRGQVVAQIGNSGDARWPHLHFQVTSGPAILASEGLPYLIDRYRIKPGGDGWETRTREFPLGGQAIDFGAQGPGSREFPEKVWRKAPIL